jgi:hypothetical protein
MTCLSLRKAVTDDHQPKPYHNNMNPYCQFTAFLFLLLINGVSFRSLSQSAAPGSKKPMTSTVDSSHLQEIRIDPFATPIAKTSEFLDSVKYLPLETNKASTFGEISQLEVTEKYYIIWDHVTNSIFFFDKNGKFHKKITNKDKELTVPYLEIGGFTANRQKNLMIVNDRHFKYEYYYDLEGNYKGYAEKKAYPSEYLSFADLNVYDWGYYPGYLNPTESLTNTLTIVAKGLKKNYFPYNATVINGRDVYGADQAFYYNQNGRVYFSQSYDYNIYSIDTTGRFYIDYKFILPAINTVPDDFLTSPDFTGKRLKYTEEHNELLYSVSDFYKVGENLIFRMRGFGHTIISVYSVSSGNHYSLLDCIADKVTFKLPIVPRQNQRIYALGTDGCIISNVEAHTLFKNKTLLSGNKEWNESLPKALRTFFKGDTQQNPVLTIMYLKQNI